MDASALRVRHDPGDGNGVKLPLTPWGCVSMAMICPQCHGAYEQRLQCPRCDVRLSFQERRSASASTAAPGGWQQTPWGRLAIGLILAQGIFHGLRHLCQAGLLASDAADQKEFWDSLSGLALMQGLQIIGLFIGALLAGAGQRQGVVYGAVLGVWNGVLLVLVQPEQSELLNKVTLYALPLLQAGLGALAGWVGSVIWRPLTPAVVPGASRALLKTIKRERRKWFAGPVAWPRVVIGTAAAVGGTLWAGVALDLVLKASDNALTPGSNLQARVVTWEITALAILAGAAVAGATTRNGLKQGLVVGIATAAVLIGIRLASPYAPSFELLVATMFAPVILGILGGGFGSKLLPPIVSNRMRSLHAS